MIFLGYIMIYFVRYNLSVHILDMTSIIRGRHESHGNTITNDSDKISMRNHADIRTGVILSIISFDNWKIAVLFSAYYIGYVACFPLFHNLADRLGPTWVVGITGITSGTLSCLTPAAAYFDFWAVCLVRVFNGFCSAAMLPSMIQLTRHWVPPIERHYFMWAYCGITTGTFSTFLLCAAVQYQSKWCVGFYTTGIMQIIWALIWLSVIADYPAKHLFITKVELDYLGNTIGTIFTIKLTNAQTPWLQVLKSVPFWALCTLNFGYAWMIMSVCIHAPLYYFAVVEYSIYSASALTALPFMLRLILGTVIIQVYQWQKNNAKNKDIVRRIRKYFIVVSHVVPGLLVASTWCMHVIPGPIILTVAVTMTAAGMDLTLDLCYELSPNFLNSLITIIKIIGHVPGIIVPLTVGEVTYRYRNSPYVWKHIWCFHGLILFISGLIFLIWGEMKVQPWSYQKNRSNPLMRKKKPRPTKMSNIIEIDEEECISAKQSVQGSILMKPLKNYLQHKS